MGLVGEVGFLGVVELVVVVGLPGVVEFSGVFAVVDVVGLPGVGVDVRDPEVDMLLDVKVDVEDEGEALVVVVGVGCTQSFTMLKSSKRISQGLLSS